MLKRDLPVLRSVGGLLEQSMIKSEWASSEMALHRDAAVVSCWDRPCKLAALMNLVKNEATGSEETDSYILTPHEHNNRRHSGVSPHLDTSAFVLSSELVTLTCVWLKACAWKRIRTTWIICSGWKNVDKQEWSLKKIAKMHFDALKKPLFTFLSQSTYHVFRYFGVAKWVVNLFKTSHRRVIFLFSIGLKWLQLSAC